MYQIRVHGRDGEDVVTAAELIASAAIHSGHNAKVFPNVGSTRPLASFEASCRIDNVPIRTSEPTGSFDAVLVLDTELFDLPGVLDGLRPGGLAVVNAPGSIEDQPGVRVVTVPATEISLAHGGRAFPGGPMLGAFAAAGHAISLVALRKAITTRFSGARCEADLAGADCAYERLQSAGPTALDAVEAMEAVMEAHRAP